jgi:hypothetical protein
MLIQVIRCDNRCDSVQDDMLDSLIEAKDIVKFKRGTKWVTVGKHPVGNRKREKAVKANDEIAAKDSSFAGQIRKVSSSSLEPF